MLVLGADKVCKLAVLVAGNLILEDDVAIFIRMYLMP